jgi:hypothetical protein
MIFDFVLVVIFMSNRNYITNFIQKISLLRFALEDESVVLYNFLYSLKFSYFNYGSKSLDKILPDDYI